MTMAMKLIANRIFCGKGSGISAMSGAPIVQKRASALQNPSVVAPKTIGNNSRLPRYRHMNVPS